MKITEYVDFNWDNKFPGEKVKKALSLLDEMNLSQEEISILASQCYKSLAEFQGGLLDGDIGTNFSAEEINHSMVMIRQSLDDISENIILFDYE
jgi:hypothetical protein